MSNTLPPGYEVRVASSLSETCPKCIARSGEGIRCLHDDLKLPRCGAREYYIYNPIPAKDQLHSALVKAGIIDRYYR
jgi:hypothetical protein